MTTPLNEIRGLLINPTSAGIEQRKDVSTVAAVVKMVAGSGALVSVGIAVFGLLICGSYPILGTITLLSFAGMGLACREVCTVASNIEKLCSSMLLSVPAARSAAILSENILQDTWIIQPLAGSLLTQLL